MQAAVSRNSPDLCTKINVLFYDFDFNLVSELVLEIFLFSCKNLGFDFGSHSMLSNWEYTAMFILILSECPSKLQVPLDDHWWFLEYVSQFHDRTYY